MSDSWQDIPDESNSMNSEEEELEDGMDADSSRDINLEYVQGKLHLTQFKSSHR